MQLYVFTKLLYYTNSTTATPYSIACILRILQRTKIFSL